MKLCSELRVAVDSFPQQQNGHRATGATVQRKFHFLSQYFYQHTLPLKEKPAIKHCAKALPHCRGGPLAVAQEVHFATSALVSGTPRETPFWPQKRAEHKTTAAVTPRPNARARAIARCLRQGRAGWIGSRDRATGGMRRGGGVEHASAGGHALTARPLRPQPAAEDARRPSTGRPGRTPISGTLARTDGYIHARSKRVSSVDVPAGAARCCLGLRSTR